MRVYIRDQEGSSLIEKGEILSIRVSKTVYLATGNSMNSLVQIAEFKSEKEAKRVLEEIIQRIVEPKAREVERGVIYIDLTGIE